MFRQGFGLAGGAQFIWLVILLSAIGLPFIGGWWFAQFIAKVYGIISAGLMAVPFFHDDLLKVMREQAQNALLHESAQDLRSDQIEGLDEIADEPNLAHLNMMRVGLVLLAAAFAIEIIVLLPLAPTRG